ncbi:MAG: hypothetical protein KA436_09630 [Oligoflexales bacterium]|nr:hypothetical protein [Oligoflexales bacterium]
MMRFVIISLFVMSTVACNFDHLDSSRYWNNMEKEAETANRVLPSLTDDGQLPSAKDQVK